MMRSFPCLRGNSFAIVPPSFRSLVTRAFLLGALVLSPLSWRPTLAAEAQKDRAGAGAFSAMLIEAESLEAQGGWILGNDTKGVRAHIIGGSSGRTQPVAGGIMIPRAGQWRLWVRSKDFAKDRAGTRHYTVRLGATRIERRFGTHAAEGFHGWEWEDGGIVSLAAGPLLVVIGDESTPFARCDALVLSRDLAWRPQGAPSSLKAAFAKRAPLERRELASASKAQGERSPVPDAKRLESLPSATLGNEAVRFRFVRAPHLSSSDGKRTNASAGSGSSIVVVAEMRKDGAWIAFDGDPAAEEYRILHRPRASDPKLAAHVHPTWDSSYAGEIEVGAGGAWVRTVATPSTAPWAGGICERLRPSAARQVDANTVALEFPETQAGRLTALWRLSDGSEPEARVELSFAAKAPGHYSLGYHSFFAKPPERADFLLLPPMYHGRRFPERPKVLLSATTPTPIALVNGAGASLAVLGEPSDIPFAWPAANNSRYALGLRGDADLAQPIVYTPVLGQPGSVLESAGNVKARFRVRVQAGDWYAAWRSVAENVYRLKDYRRPVNDSLSDAALNLYDLLKDERAAGWDPRVKGSWNIESRNIASHASPLTFLSLYLLTGDEDFYVRFARPALEYLMSRPGAHFGAERKIGDNYYQHRRMEGPVSVYGASVFASAVALTHGRTPALAAMTVDAKGEPRPTRGYSHVQPWEDALALYRMSGDRRYLDAAVEGANRYVAENLAKLPTRDLGPVPFVNMAFVPDWEGLLHVYEETGDRRFLDAAAEGARWLLSTLWVQPLVPSGEVTLHKGGSYDHARHIWYFGDLRYRLGIVEGAACTSDPAHDYKLGPTPLSERRVPAWRVSNVGLGLEQPVTYTRKNRHGNILMSTWAPNLLRLAALTGDPLFRTAARNATIGRFANYPGYYADGMTDQYSRADYPFKGPDVTTIYHHHIPPFTAYVLDYLFTDAEMRSAGAVAFPWVRQCGYVWFDARLRGHAPGRIYGHTAWPWLHRTAATVDTVTVDRVLAHGDGRFFAILLNQTGERQRTRVRFDAAVLGRRLAGVSVARWSDNRESAALTMDEAGSVEVDVSPNGIVVLGVDGVKIDVPTHRVAPPKSAVHPTDPAVRSAVVRKPTGLRGIDAVGTEIHAPPFAWRDLFVYVAAGIDECRSATLRYRVGNGPERTVEDDSYPWEFTVRVDDADAPIVWSVETKAAVP